VGVRERKEREFHRREREILDAALALFATDGWRAVTVEQIAERAEIGKGTVYKHFPSKQEIYARLALDFHQAVLAELERLDPALPVMRRLRRMIEVIWSAHMQAAQYQRLVQYCEAEDFRRGLTVETQERLAALDASFHDCIDEVLREGVAAGILPRKPLPALIFGPTATLKGAIRLAWSGQLPQVDSPDAHLAEITNFILAGMLCQEWLADEGLSDDAARQRAEAVQRAVEQGSDAAGNAADAGGQGAGRTAQ
jgi:AcrR family transcriptional regulator